MTDTPAGPDDLDKLHDQIQSELEQAGDLQSQIQDLTAKIQADSEPSQEDMINLQSSLDKYNETMEALTSLSQQMAAEAQKISSNIH
jgi:hypothetical protein